MHTLARALLPVVLIGVAAGSPRPAAADGLEGDLCFAIRPSNGVLAGLSCDSPPEYQATEYLGFDTNGDPCEQLGSPYGLCYASDAAWTLSRSAVDPEDNAGPLDPTDPVVYLWFVCARYGTSGAEFAIAGSLEPSIEAFVPMNGFLNAGTATDLVLAVGGCPENTVLAGRFVLSGTTHITRSSWGDVRSLYR